MIELIAALIWLIAILSLYAMSPLADLRKHKFLEGVAIIVGTLITIAIPIGSLGLLSECIYAPAILTVLGVIALIAMSLRKKKL